MEYKKKMKCSRVSVETPLLPAATPTDAVVAPATESVGGDGK